MKTARLNTGQENLFDFSIVYLTGSTPVSVLFSLHRDFVI